LFEAQLIAIIRLTVMRCK